MALEVVSREAVLDSFHLSLLTTWSLLREMPQDGSIEERLVVGNDCDIQNTTSSVEIVDWPVNWPQIIDAAVPRLAGHESAWIDSISSGLRQRVYCLQTRRDNDVTGILPLHLVSGPIFGKFLVSSPYINTGGVWAQSHDDAAALVGRACELADELDVKYLELRHETPVEHPRINFTRTDKVHMRLELPDSSDALMKSFKSKLRSQVKKSREYGLVVEFGGEELLADYYAVFAQNMRDLGTPVFSKSLFANILRSFKGRAELCVVRKESQPIAAGVLIHNHGVSEVPSASSLREFNRTNANMLMYWHLMSRAIERGSHTFDFGRSSEGSGTFKFKSQWGAKPQPANWQYYVRKGSPEEMRPDDEGKQRLVKLWQKLPVWATKLIGPEIVRGIP
ncbi:MAG: FemAB family PEP-CTERM system-associated protein [Rubripirellula sp.]|nr:FemAB family PEP-CTERM system-associated protein [Rubripirellula sp.]